jgi:hypothetical protein
VSGQRCDRGRAPARRGGRVAGHKGVHQRLSETIDVLAVHAVFEPREGGGTGQVLCGLQGQPLDAKLEQGIMTQAVGIVAVGIARGDLIDPLGQEVPQWMGDVRRVALVTHGRREARCEANLVIDAAQQEDPKVRRQGTTLEVGADGMPRHGRKGQLFWSRIGHGQTSSDLYGIDRSHVLFYQRLGGSLPFFMKNPG